jgi:DNA-binding transcriptional MocR family regulator
MLGKTVAGKSGFPEAKHMILLNLNRTNHIPLYQQVIDQIKEMVENDILEPGTRLPSSRIMAEKLGVNRSTITNAYQELWAQGYIDSRPGSYSCIRKRFKMATVTRKQKKGILEWDKISSTASQQIYREYLAFRPEKQTLTGKNIINFAQLDMDHRLFPCQDFRRCMNKVLIDNGSKILGYGEYQGYKPLRETIARRLQFHGISVSHEEILITNGSQNGIELILKLLSVPGKSVIIEAPTYAIVIPLLKYYGCDIKAVPLREDGIDMHQLEKVLCHRISFLYTMPNFQNPSGVTSSQSNRERLLELCESKRIPIVEDGFEEEMKYFGKVPPPIKSMDKNNFCIYLGTFSKVLFPGVRIGWIAAEKECIQRLLAIKRFSDLTSSPVLQAAINEFCIQGYYDLHIRRMHRIYRKRMNCARLAIGKYVDRENISWHEPSGGYLIWLQFKNLKFSEQKLVDWFEKNGILVSPGRYYYHRPEHETTIRLSISTLNEAEIEEGIKRLGNAINQINQ